MKKNVYIFLLLLLIGISFPSNVWAHASLIEATPPPNSQLDEAPKSISLTFNERLESDLYYLRLYNEDGEKVTDNKANMSKNQQTISLDNIPKLKTGVYSVNYKVISADGHPIGETYIITIGDAQMAGDSLDELSKQSQFANIYFYILRMAYFLGILLTAGWLFWGRMSGVNSSSAEQAYQKWFKYLRIFLLVILLGYGFYEFNSLLSGLGINELKSLLLGTSFGLAWTMMLGLSIIGFWVLHRSRVIDGLWIILLLGGEAITGHAITYQPIWYTIALDLVHLVAASIWISGIIMLIVFWKNHTEFTKKFLPRFSTYALVSILVLVITGSLLTVVFLPDLTLLWTTLWGKILLIKTFGVLFVILTGYLLRKTWKKENETSLKKQLVWDFSLMLGIVLLAAILTTISPLPENEPISWDETKNNTSIHVDIGPGNPGVPNTFNVVINMKNGKIDREHVSLELKPLEKDIAAIDVPIKFVKKEANKVVFTAKGPFLSLPGKWKSELRVRDQEDNATVFTDTFTIYPTKR